jgi:hypothetical protein
MLLLAFPKSNQKESACRTAIFCLRKSYFSPAPVFENAGVARSATIFCLIPDSRKLAFRDRGSNKKCSRLRLPSISKTCPRRKTGV